MNEYPRYLLAEIKNPDDEHLEYIGDITVVVLFGLKCDNGDVLYLEIRYIDFENGVVDGDHVTGTLEEAYQSAFEHYGLLKDDWRNLSKDQIERIDRSIK